MTGNLTNLEIGNIFFGEMAELSTSPSINIVDGRSWKTKKSEGAGGYRFSQITNIVTRKNWQYEFEYLNTSNKTAIENVAGQVYTSNQLSHYPLYFSDDDGTTIYFARLLGNLSFNQIAYQAYSTVLNLEQEL